MNKQQIKEAILGKDNCPKEETPLTQFATFHPDMERVELLLKGADINKSFNNQPLSWILQFCKPNLDTIVQLLFKYKYYSLYLNKMRDFKSLLIILSMVKTKTMMEILKIMK